MNRNRQEKGITLIALVVTIIILLILAGISIQAITSDNGLFKRAKQAKQNTIDAQELENEILKNYENFEDVDYSNVGKEEDKDSIENYDDSWHRCDG